MSILFLELIRPTSVALTPRDVERLTRQTNWPTFCSLVHQSGLAPLVYERLGKHARFLPEGVSEWLKLQYDQTIERNSFLFNEFKHVTTTLSNAGIAVMVFKGPVLAFLGLGLKVRTFHDLDLLVQRRDVEAVAERMKALGYGEVLDAPHPYHHRYMRTDGDFRAVVELHFDLVDPVRSYVPDVAAIWDRSVVVDMFGHAARVPELSDHLLLTMMQLPHHHWTPRLLADIAQLVSRWGNTIDWTSLVARANAWGMRALVGSTLYTVASVLHVTLPEQARNCIVPETYFRRVQWHIARQAAAEQFVQPSPKFWRLAQYLVLDRFGDVPWLVVRRAFRADGTDRVGRSPSSILRRLLLGALGLAPLLAVLVKSAFKMKPSNTGVHEGKKRFIR